MRLLLHRRWPVVVAGMAGLLTLPSLWAGLLLDDHFNQVVIRQPEELAGLLPHRLDTYNFLDGDPTRFEASMDRGVWPWWSDPTTRAAFWRPLTALTQWIDYTLWPDHPGLMHLQSVAWYAGLVLAVAVLFRRILGVSAAAGLAALLYAVDEGHGVPVGFLAARNGIVACLFGVLAVLLHDGWRRGNRPVLAGGAAACFAAALLSAEAGIGALAYLAAYAVCLDDARPWPRRLASLLPYLAVLVVWRVAWSAMGYGVEGLILYTDPLREPLRFLSVLWRRAPLLITGQYIFLPGEVLSLGWALAPWTWWISAALATLFVASAWPMVRTNPTARFFGLGALLALVPVCATFPQNRNLVFAGIGAFGLLALWLTDGMHDLPWPRTVELAAIVLVVIHLVVAPLLLPILSLYPLGASSAFETLGWIPGMQQIAGRDLIIVNHPLPPHLLHLLGDRAANGRPLPAHTRILTHALAEVTLERLTPHQLRVRSSNGLPDLASCLLGASPSHLAAGDEVHLSGLDIRITDSDPTGTPVEAVFHFDRTLEDDALRWVQWRDGEFHPFTPPAVGETVTVPSTFLPGGIPGVDFDAAIRRALLRTHVD